MHAASIMCIAFTGSPSPVLGLSRVGSKLHTLPRHGSSATFLSALPHQHGKHRQWPPAPPSSETMLRATAFTFVLGISLTTLTPAPHLVAKLGQVEGMKLLTALATTSAATEIALSPIVGGLSDSMGRKPVLVAALVCASLANAVAAIAPSVASVALAKFVGSLVVGTFFLTAGTILADRYRTGDSLRLEVTTPILPGLTSSADSP